MKEKDLEAVKFELTEDLVNGRYANLVVTSHSEEEFVLDFAAVLPGLPGPRIVSRIVMTPRHLKRFLASLQSNLERFEEKHGSIGEVENEGDFVAFSGSMPEA